MEAITHEHRSVNAYHWHTDWDHPGCQVCELWSHTKLAVRVNSRESLRVAQDRLMAAAREIAKMQKIPIDELLFDVSGKLVLGRNLMLHLRHL